MKRNEVLASVLEKLSNAVAILTDEDIEKLVTGSHSIELKIVRNRANSKNLNEVEGFDPADVVRQLNQFTDRVIASNHLRDLAKNKKMLESLARYLDIALSKQDKTEDLINKIIESTVGARLRSSAIRGSEV
jgi:hypothetical protein